MALNIINKSAQTHSRNTSSIRQRWLGNSFSAVKTNISDHYISHCTFQSQEM